MSAPAITVDQHPGWAAVAQRFGRFVVIPTLARVHLVGAEHVPTQGPVLLAANHVSIWDGPVLFSHCPRPTSFLVKSEFFTALGGMTGYLLRQIGQVPVQRGTADRTALTAALAALHQGAAVGVFPEGTRGAGDFAQLQRGLAWLAVRSAAPVVPVVLHGNDTGWPRRRARGPVTIVFGPPVQPVTTPGPGNRHTVGAAAETIRTALVAHLEATGTARPVDAP